MVGEQLLALVEEQQLEQEQREWVVERTCFGLVFGDRSAEFDVGVCRGTMWSVEIEFGWSFLEGDRK